MNPDDDAPPSGQLLLVPNALDHGTEPGPLQDVLPAAVIDAAAALSHWVVEDARSARAFLKRVQALRPLAQPLQAIEIRPLPRPAKGHRSDSSPQPDWSACLAPALAGHDIGLLSEAGLPAVADPGAELVAAAHRMGVPVRPLPGPSALVMALAASGLHGQSFAFVGYVPQDAPARAQRLRELEATSRRLRQTQLLIEAPYRNGALLRALVETLAPDTRLSVSCGLTWPGGWTRSERVTGWRERPATLSDRMPAVFALLAG